MAAVLGQIVGKPWEVSEDANYDAEAYLAANTGNRSGLYLKKI